MSDDRSDLAAVLYGHLAPHISALIAERAALLLAELPPETRGTLTPETLRDEIMAEVREAWTSEVVIAVVVPAVDGAVREFIEGYQCGVIAYSSGGARTPQKEQA